MSITPAPVERQLQLLQDQIYEQQDTLNAYMVLARKPTQAATIVPLIFRTSTKLRGLIKDIYSLGSIPDLTREIISLYAEIQESRGPDLFRADRVSENDPRVDNHQLWTTLRDYKAKGKTPSNESVPNREENQNDNPAGELSEVAKGKRREVIAAVEIKMEPMVAPLVPESRPAPSKSVVWVNPVARLKSPQQNETATPQPLKRKISIPAADDGAETDDKVKEVSDRSKKRPRILAEDKVSDSDESGSVGPPKDWKSIPQRQVCAECERLGKSKNCYVPNDGRKVACFQCSRAKKRCSLCPDRSRGRAKSAPAAAKPVRSRSKKAPTPPTGTSKTKPPTSKVVKAKQNRVQKNEDIPVVVVPPFRSLRTPPDLDADASPELPALRENIRQLQQRLTTAESCLTGLIGIFQGQLIDQRTGLLPEWLHPYVKEVSKDQDHLPSTSGRAATPVERQGPSPGQTIYSPRTQRPLNPPTLPIPKDSPTPTASAIEPPAAKSIEELADLPVPTQGQPTEESSVRQPDTLKNEPLHMVQAIIQNMPDAAGMQTEPPTLWATHMRDPPFSQLLQGSEGTAGNSMPPAGQHASPGPSGSGLAPQHSPLPRHPHAFQAETDGQTFDEMETTCIDYSPK